MVVRTFDIDGGVSALCCYTDAAGARWCLKEIRNIKTNGFSKMFICSGQRCNFKLYYTPLLNSVQKVSIAAHLTTTVSIGGQSTDRWHLT